MTTLLVEPLKDTLEQRFRLKLDRRYVLASLLPYLYLHNAPAGTFTLSLLKDEFTVFSHEFTSQDVKDSLNTDNNYLHVFFPVVPINPLILGPCDFTMRLEAEDYFSTSSSSIGWIQQHEDLNNELDYIPTSDSQNPFAMRLKEYKKDMHMQIGFADGFTSASAPDISGSVQENFILENNRLVSTEFEGLIFDKTKETSAFALIEFERYHEVAGIPETYRGTQEITFVVIDDEWVMLPGSITGLEMIQETISQPYEVTLSIDPASGQVSYLSGDMTGTDYEGKAKTSITRISIV